MALTEAQKTTLGLHIRANLAATVVQDFSEGNHNAITDWYNGNAVPDFWGFKSSLTTMFIREHGIDWGELLAPGSKIASTEQWSFTIMTQNGVVNPSNPNIRVGFENIFSSHQTTLQNLLAASVRLATEAEKVFAVPATGPAGGDGSAQNAAAMLVFSGDVPRNDITDALNLTAP